MIKKSKERWESAPKWRKRLIAGFFIAGGVVLFGLALGYLIMWLWNSLMPALFSLPEITYWQSVGIFILARIIFGCSIGSGEGKEKKSSKNKKNKNEEQNSEDGDNESWEHYNEWWENEGKKAFDEYVNKNQSGKE